jgi:hypothetical protein
MHHDEEWLTLQEYKFYFTLIYKQNRNVVTVTEFYIAVPESPVQSNCAVDGVNYIPCQNGEEFHYYFLFIIVMNMLIIRDVPLNIENLIDIRF